MKRTIAWLFGLCLVVGLAVPGMWAQDKPESSGKTTAGAKKEVRWHGRVLRISKDESYLDVRRGNADKRVHFDNSTKWTKLNKPADPNEIKEGADVICLGEYDAKNEFHATRIDLRRD